MRKAIAEKLAAEVRDRLGDAYIVRYKEVAKNNGVKLQAVSIAKDGETASRVVYIDEMIDHLESLDIDIQDSDIQDAAMEVITTYMDHADEGMPEFVKHLDKDMILQKVVLKMISREKNTQRLLDMPHRDLLDLSAVYVVVDEGDGALHSIAVTRLLCEKYGIDDEELFLSARKNTMEIGFQARTVVDVLEEITGEPVECPDFVPPLLVISTKTQLYGASTLLFNGELDKLAERYGSDLYVLPSSIHEVIAVPVGDLDPDELRLMVFNINKSEVFEEDQLSYNVYRYSRKDGCLTIA